MSNNNKKDGPRCTAGEDLTGIEFLVNEVLMQTELYDGYGAYKLSYAKGNSGFSFGPSQIDLSERTQSGLTGFVDILKNACDKNGQLIIDEHKLQTICGEKNINLSKKNITPEKMFGSNLDLINKALSSDFGVKKVNEMYVKDLRLGLANVDSIIADMKNPAAREYYNTDLGRVLLFEYHNQFDLKKNGSFLQEYINGTANGKERKDYTTGAKYPAPTEQYTLADHKKFLHSTKEWYNNEQAVAKSQATKNALDNRFNKALDEFYKKCSVAEAQSFFDDVNNCFLAALQARGFSEADIYDYDKFLASYEENQDFQNSPALCYIKNEDFLDDYLSPRYYYSSLDTNFNGQGFSYPSSFDFSRFYEIKYDSPFNWEHYSLYDDYNFSNNGVNWNHYDVNADYNNYNIYEVNHADYDFDMSHYYDNNFNWSSNFSGYYFTSVCGVQENTDRSLSKVEPNKALTLSEVINLGLRLDSSSKEALNFYESSALDAPLEASEPLAYKPHDPLTLFLQESNF